MKKKTLVLGFGLVLSCGVFAQESEDSVNNRIIKIEKSVESIKYKNGQLENSVVELRTLIGQQAQSKDSLQNVVNGNATEAKKQQQTMQKSIDNAVSEQSKIKSGIGIRSVVLIVVALVLSALVFLLLRKKIQKSDKTISELDQVQKQNEQVQTSIQQVQRSLQEESLKMDNKLIEILERQISINKQEGKTEEKKEVDHSFALNVANEITRMEVNLSRMDSSVKGYKQLSAAIRRMKDDFSAKGYEIVEMLGKKYDEGMRVVTTFVADENLEEGEQIITKVIKPQVNYNGEMIQQAQIQVNQGE
jgi:hypothetical protein